MRRAIACGIAGCTIAGACIVIGGLWPPGPPWSGEMGTVVEGGDGAPRVVAYFAIEPGVFGTRADLEVRVPGGLAEQFDGIGEDDLPQWSGQRDWRDAIDWHDGFTRIESRIGLGWPFVGVVLADQSVGAVAGGDMVSVRPIELVGNVVLAADVTYLAATGVSSLVALRRRRTGKCVVCGQLLALEAICPECGSPRSSGSTTRARSKRTISAAK